MLHGSGKLSGHARSSAQKPIDQSLLLQVYKSGTLGLKETNQAPVFTKSGWGQ